VDYAKFEGEIPSGEYGAGTVVVWDTGAYRNLTERDGEHVPMPRAIDDGHVVVWLDGAKLTGAYALTRAKLAGGTSSGCWSRRTTRVPTGAASQRRPSRSRC